jgi:flavin reductase (DIM6/NTAB) family NADH-FMN oxidoreductase RutF
MTGCARADRVGLRAMKLPEDARKTFNGLMSELDYPMFIVTTVNDAGERSGCLIGFATQISIKPPRFLTGLSHKNHTYRVVREADHVGVHFVPEDGNELAELFGGETGDEIDKFDRCRWHEGTGGVPMLDELPNRFVGRILERIDAGDHDALILEPVAVERPEPEEELTFHRAKRIEPGHAP